MDYTRFCPSVINKETHPHLSLVTKCWQTTIYEILYDEPKGFKHLRISRVDGEPIRSWKDIQEIKNDLLGEDVVAIEVFPKQCDFVNVK